MNARVPFHIQLKHERERRGWSQNELAERVGTDTKTISRWESGGSLPRPYSRQKLSELFGKDAEELGLFEDVTTHSTSPDILATAEDIEFTIQEGDITTFEADVVALKYAQNFYGTDQIVAYKLTDRGIQLENLRSPIGGYRFIATKGSIGVRDVLFVGVPDLGDFGYPQIRDFSAQVLRILAREAPNTRYLAMTVHGVGFGLDEVEAIRAQFAGYMDAIQSGNIPLALRKITIVDIHSGRVQRLRQALENGLNSAYYASKVETGTQWAYRIVTQPLKDSFKTTSNSTKAIETAGTKSVKPHVFVAMPFTEDMDDVFYFGIQQPVHAAGFLCERVDQDRFTGDILDRIKKKIETAVAVIAELSNANPNVYLEVGYAWGKERPTILLAKEGQELKFDVRGQRCLKYKRIRDLEEALKEELKELHGNGTY